ncbi:potassium transporter [Metasolibacillus meyeri]|uniref:Potassium transporter n=1 Tax=Metasolibacillus meyeri TaxID=1071052 RepID=A0AAW9NRY6_9BACL|nr:potassium transporter [Metasolibacillus meyeri]MEC1179241.1 potassium transporter [Metasolibacillus meyeri]
MFSNKNSAPILLTVLVALLLFVSYYYFVLPKKEQAERLHSAVSSLQEEIMSLQSQIAMKQSEESQVPENLFVLQKKVPQHKDIVNLLLNMEEIGLLSASKITGMQFNNYDALVSESELQDISDSETVTEQQFTEELPTSSIAKEALPPELQMVTFNVELESRNESDFTIFLKELESLERIIRIDQIDLQVPGEADLIEDAPPKTVSTKIQATTFYYEGE